MLKDVSSIPLAKEAAKYHHERWDGKGYPEGLAKEAMIGSLIGTIINLILDKNTNLHIFQLT